MFVFVLQPGYRFVSVALEWSECPGLGASDVQQLVEILDEVEESLAVDESGLRACDADEEAADAWVVFPPATDLGDVRGLMSTRGFRKSDSENCYEYSDGRRNMAYWFTNTESGGVRAIFYVERSWIDLCSALVDSDASITKFAPPR